MELIIGSLLGSGFLLVGHLGVLVRSRILGHTSNQRGL
jgi:hypothetical protein